MNVFLFFTPADSFVAETFLSTIGEGEEGESIRKRKNYWYNNK